MSVMRLTDASTTIDFDPAAGYIQPRILRATHHRAATGKSYSYKWWEKERWEVPTDRLSKTDADQLNSWWDSLTELTFYPDMINSPTTSYTVLLKNTTAPMRMQGPVFADKYSGTLILEEI